MGPHNGKIQRTTSEDIVDIINNIIASLRRRAVTVFNLLARWRQHKD